jgi:hypothetical protein
MYIYIFSTFICPHVQTATSICPYSLFCDVLLWVRWEPVKNEYVIGMDYTMDFNGSTQLNVNILKTVYYYKILTSSIMNCYIDLLSQQGLSSSIGVIKHFTLVKLTH